MSHHCKIRCLKTDKLFDDELVEKLDGAGFRNGTVNIPDWEWRGFREVPHYIYINLTGKSYYICSQKWGRCQFAKSVPTLNIRSVKKIFNVRADY